MSSSYRAPLLAAAISIAWGSAIGSGRPDRLTATQIQASDPGRESTAVQTVDQKEIAELVDQFFKDEMERAHIPGGVFLMVRDSQVLFARGYGFADLERRIPADPEHTVWRVGSNSKTLTAVAVLQLVERGQADLETDINRYLTRFQVPPTYPEPITLFHLLTHTAGFDERLFGQHAATRADWLSLEDYLASRLTPRTSPPGAVVSYNDHGTALAGLIVETISGRPFADYVEENIFRPLDMGRSSFEVAFLPDEIRERLAVAYRSHEGRHLRLEYDYIITAPAAGLVSTAADIGRLLMALLQGGQLSGQRILSDSLTREMLRPQFRHHPKLPGRAFGFAESRENGQFGLYKDGQATGFTARMFLLPDHGIGFFSAINLSIFGPRGSFNHAARFHRRLTTVLLDRLFPTGATSHEAMGKEVISPGPDVPSEVSRFVGTYRPVVGSRHTLEKILFLFQEIRVSDNGDGSLAIGSGRWIQREPLLFQWHEGGPFYRAFRENSSGRVTHLFASSGALERVPWHSTAAFNLRLLGLFVVLFLSACLIWPGQRVIRRGRKRNDASHPGRWPMFAAAALNLAFVIGFFLVFLLTDFQQFFKGVPPVLAAILALPLVAGMFSVMLPFFSIRAWRNRQGSPLDRLYYLVIMIALLLFIPFLHNWNLLGWKY